MICYPRFGLAPEGARREPFSVIHSAADSYFPVP